MELMSTMSRGTGRKPGDKLNPDGEVINASAALQKMWGRSEKDNLAHPGPHVKPRGEGDGVDDHLAVRQHISFLATQPSITIPTTNITKDWRHHCCHLTYRSGNRQTWSWEKRDWNIKGRETRCLTAAFEILTCCRQVGEKWVCRVWRRGLASFILYPTKSKSSADSFVSSLNDSYRPRDALQYNVVEWVGAWKGCFVYSIRRKAGACYETMPNGGRCFRECTASAEMSSNLNAAQISLKSRVDMWKYMWDICKMLFQGFNIHPV